MPRGAKCPDGARRYNASIPHRCFMKFPGFYFGESAIAALTRREKFQALRDVERTSFISRVMKLLLNVSRSLVDLRALAHHGADEFVPAWMRALDLRAGPSFQVAQSERDTRRSAHSHVAMDDDALRARPRIYELTDGHRVLAREQDVVGWVAHLGQIAESEPEHRCEARRKLRRVRFGIKDRNADLPTCWFVLLRIET